ncbi:MAG: glycosyltransferase [Kangiellaceae bacterium]|nr:glycosyltransferase [Kangiellaceae bacterium]
MSEKQTIAYVGPFSFPNGGAAARRIVGISKTLQLLNYKVVIGTGQCDSDAPENNDFEGISVCSLNERTAEHLPKLFKHLLYFSMGKKTISWLDSLEKKPAAVILYSGYSPYLMRLLPWCKRNKVPLIFDAVEWYDPPSLIQGILNPYYWNIELAMRYFLPKTKNIIAISKYLQSYYQSKGCRTIRIPPTLDVKQVALKTKTENSPKIKLGYTGSPGHKDLLDNVLAALLEIDEHGEKFEFNIAGITTEQLLNYPALRIRNFTSLPSCFKCYGIVPQHEAFSIIRQSDFSVLLRPNKRYAKAGFPTKFVESFSVGTPVIANHTSDLADYLIDGKTGVVCDNESPASLKKGLLRVLDFDNGDLEVMREAARQIAKSQFDFRTSKNSLAELLNSCQRNAK